jgi:hypothetical protein
MDATKWKLEEVYSLGELKLSHMRGDITAKIDTDRVSTPTSMLRQGLLEAFKSADVKGQIVHEDRRIVNGREILAIQFDVTVDGKRSRVFGYYHGGSSGQIQVIAYAPASKFATRISEITELLDGLEVRDQDPPPSASGDHISRPGLLSVSSSISLSFDPTIWKQTATTDSRYFDFLHPSGRGIAEVGVERTTSTNVAIGLGLPNPDYLFPQYLVISYKASYPNAKLLSGEKRMVNGTEVWFVKLETGRRGKLPSDKEILWGYYYCDRGGTIEAEIFGDKAFFRDYEKDVMAFLNGLRISEVENRITRNFERPNRSVHGTRTCEPWRKYVVVLRA